MRSPFLLCLIVQFFISLCDKTFRYIFSLEIKEEEIIFCDKRNVESLIEIELKLKLQLDTR